jgi:hypothetical protein
VVSRRRWKATRRGSGRLSRAALRRCRRIRPEGLPEALHSDRGLTARPPVRSHILGLVLLLGLGLGLVLLLLIRLLVLGLVLLPILVPIRRRCRRSGRRRRCRRARRRVLTGLGRAVLGGLVVPAVLLILAGLAVLAGLSLLEVIHAWAVVLAGVRGR